MKRAIMGVLGCVSTYKVKFILKPFTNDVLLCNLYLHVQVINNQSILAKSSKYLLCFGNILSACCNFVCLLPFWQAAVRNVFALTVNKSMWPQRGQQRGYASWAHRKCTFIWCVCRLFKGITWSVWNKGFHFYFQRDNLGFSALITE